MKQASKQYIPFQPLQWPNRQWPNKTITKAPIWCSVDLRDRESGFGYADAAGRKAADVQDSGRYWL